MKKDVVFWDVDTQHDFMDAGGKLYVPGAESIKPNLARLTRYAKERGIPIIASADDHVAGHRELSATPDFRETFPEHCMRGSTGAEKIPETALRDPLVIEPAPMPHNELARRLHSHTGDVLIRKHWFDVFSNPNTETLLDVWSPTEIVVYGVALDVCNKFAIEGFLSRGVPQIFVVTDATKAIHPEDADALLASWRERGATLVATEDVAQGAIV